MRLTSMIAVLFVSSVLAGSVVAAPIFADSFGGSASLAADTNAYANLLGYKLTLDNLDLPNTTVGLTGTSSIEVNKATNALSLNSLEMDLDPINVGRIYDTARASNFLGSLTVTVDLQYFTANNVHISLTSPTAPTTFVGQSQVMFENVDIHMTGDFAADGYARVVGTGLLGLIGTIDVPLATTLPVDTVFTLESLTFDLTHNGDQLTLSSAIDLASLVPADLFPIVEQDLKAGGRFADLVPEEYATYVGLISDLELTATIVGSADFSSTFIIPEPASMTLLLLGSVGMVFRRRRHS